MATKKEISHGKQFKGVVVSNKMDKTIVVSVSRFVKHPKYGKYIKHDKRFKAHVEGVKPEVGTTVTIEETRPISRDKHFRLV
ncbi:MAG: 30S ribosomal protein S17 [Candidatus Lloydbacteria bacterium RIFCSPHIGHO2_01_FULL_41_20]|uniref:Small ribosomal subunit protein uS17 n=1 Tax=Candidatus Lloydbacteria bacterium RIFCSPHIGHO2_01_FULL_41_20 TaxID=1798657 RepID=A0A1G2CRM3_9BACT|nr:MAG: 30S ribosomal protein S17 [Candidatus Lloydbacteria bacterium RIFCSPHIGHO2_01_FULL_41_20]